MEICLIDAEGLDEEIRCEMCRNPMRSDTGCDGGCTYDEKLYEKIVHLLNERIKPLPNIKPEPNLQSTCNKLATDTISRKMAVDALQKEIDKWTPPFDHVIGSVRCGVRLARNIIEDLPSAERKTGRWLRIKGAQEYVCQECGQRCLETIMSLPKWDYCPNCGAYNGGEEDETQP